MHITDPYIRALVGLGGKLNHETPFNMDGVVTDSTDLTVSSTTGHDVGSTFSLTIPAVGLVGMLFEQIHVANAAAQAYADVGLTVNAVDHWAVHSSGNDDGVPNGILYLYTNGGSFEVRNSIFPDWAWASSTIPLIVYWDVQHHGLATGAQTCKFRVRKTAAGAGNIVVKGSSKLQTQLRYFTIDQS